MRLSKEIENANARINRTQATKQIKNDGLQVLKNSSIVTYTHEQITDIHKNRPATTMHLYFSLFFTSLLVAIDYFIRERTLIPYVESYYWTFLLVLPTLIALKAVVHSIKNPAIHFTLVFLISFLLATLYFLEYGYFGIYGAFMNGEAIGVIWSNLSFWLKNSNNLVSVDDYIFYAGYFLLFFVFLYRNISEAIILYFGKAYSGLKGILVRYIPPTARDLVVIVLLIGVAGAVYNKVDRLGLPYLTAPHAFAKSMGDYLENQEKYSAHNPRQFERIAVNAPSAIEPKFNVLFIVLESINLEHMSYYGYERRTNQWLEKYLPDAYKFDHVISNATTTRHSLSSMFTGMDRTNTFADIHQSPLLWQYTKNLGLKNIYIGSHWLKWHQMDEGFIDERFIDIVDSPVVADASMGRDDYVTIAKFKTTINDVAKKEEKFFAVVHLNTTHYPYWVPPHQRLWTPIRRKGYSPNPKEIAKTINQYDNAMFKTDSSAGTAIKILKALDLFDDTIVIVSADHGEGLYKHQKWNHGGNFWQDGIHVPLIINIPPKIKQTLDPGWLEDMEVNQLTHISNVDILPTILGLYGEEPVTELSGDNLLRPYPEKVNFCTIGWDRYAAVDSMTGTKFIVNNNDGTLSYTNLNEDPDELKYKSVAINKYFQKQEVEEFAARYF